MPALRSGVSSRAFRKAATYVDRNVKALEAIADLPDDVLQPIVEQAAEATEGIARAAIAQNMRAAGIKSQTGTLQANINRVIVHPRISKGSFSFIVTFPTSGMKKYSGRSANDSYVVAGSINSGRVILEHVVRTSGDIVPSGFGTAQVRRAKAGQRAKKSIKKYALGQAEISDRAIDAIERGRTFRTGVKTQGVMISRKEQKEKSIKVGEASVVKPRRFFYLRPPQERAMIKVALEKIADLVLGEINGAANSS